jgi:hydrogenase nickel incorporation protein HypB
MRSLAYPLLRDVEQVGNRNRQLLRDADVYSVGVVGGPGCGKTTLLDATIGRLMPAVNVGVLVCELGVHRDTSLPPRNDARVVHVNAPEDGIPEEADFQEALHRLDTDWLDLLFIEHIGSLSMRMLPDLGQDVTATVFSVAAGDDKADKHPELVRKSDVILLNKTDLLQSVPFQLTVFRSDVSRLNPQADLIELSALHGSGFDGWIDWLRKRIKDREGIERAQIGNWFG